VLLIALVVGAFFIFAAVRLVLSMLAGRLTANYVETR
jgi:hypothetical protein